MGVETGNSLSVSASARPATPPSAHNKTIITGSKRRYRFCMCPPEGSARESTAPGASPLQRSPTHDGPRAADVQEHGREGAKRGDKADPIAATSGRNYGCTIECRRVLQGEHAMFVTNTRVPSPPGEVGY